MTSGNMKYEGNLCCKSKSMMLEHITSGIKLKMEHLPSTFPKFYFFALYFTVIATYYYYYIMCMMCVSAGKVMA